MPEGGKRPLERPRYRWEENIKMDLRETGLKHLTATRSTLNWSGIAISLSYNWLNITGFN
jgi:hypothetical protein